MESASELIAIHIEDNLPDALLTEKYLRSGWPGKIVLHHFSYLRDGLEFLSRENANLGKRPAVILLDLSLPDVIGLEGLRSVSLKCPDIPIIMATGHSDDALAIEALKYGAQDYIVKGQFTADSLIKAIRYAMERFKILSRARDHVGSVVTLGDLTLDTDFLKARLRLPNETRELDLTPIEFKMLLFMIRNFSKELSRQDLVKSVWGEGINIIDRTVDTHISHLRNKLRGSAFVIKSVRGIGYRMQDAHKSGS